MPDADAGVTPSRSAIAVVETVSEPWLWSA